MTPIEVVEFVAGVIRSTPQLIWAWSVLSTAFHKLVTLPEYVEQAGLFIQTVSDQQLLDESSLTHSHDQDPFLEWLFHSLLHYPEAIPLIKLSESAQSVPLSALILNQIKFMDA